MFGSVCASGIDLVGYLLKKLEKFSPSSTLVEGLPDFRIVSTLPRSRKVPPIKEYNCEQKPITSIRSGSFSAFVL